MRSLEAKRSRVLAAPFVVTISSVASLACQEPPPPRAPQETRKEVTPTNPPRPPVDDERRAPTTAPAPTSAAKPFVRRTANPLGPNAKPIYVSAKRTCWVEGASVTEKTSIACPSELDVDAWAAKCADQLVFEETPDYCQCQIFANPPYVGIVPCPKHP